MLSKYDCTGTILMYGGFNVTFELFHYNFSCIRKTGPLRTMVWLLTLLRSSEVANGLTFPRCFERISPQEDQRSKFERGYFDFYADGTIISTLKLSKRHGLQTNKKSCSLHTEYMVTNGHKSPSCSQDALITASKITSTLLYVEHSGN